MADATVSFILSMLRTTIIDKAKEEVKLLVGVEEEVKKLERNLDLIQSVLAHAEQKKRTDELVKKWLDRLKEASFDMEDALDEWRTAVELEIHGAQNQKIKVLCNFISCLSFHQLGTRRKIAVNIKEINQKLDEIVKEKDRYELRAKEIELPRRQESTSFGDAPKLYGRDGVKTTILSYLRGEKSKEEAGGIVQTISIVGMGGMGKTAIAQQIYNDQDVKRHFDHVIWVWVPNTFEEKIVATAKGIQKLTSLRNPKGIQKLTSLRNLWGAIVRADRNDAEEFSLADLGNLKYLRSVWMKVVGNSIDKGEARKALLQNVMQLRIYLAGDINKDDIIEVLDPHLQIRSRPFYNNFWLDG